MKILLLGEYSRLHNSLKKGLEYLGHEVTLVSTGDLFKKYPADISIRPRLFTHKAFPLLIRKIFLRLFKKDPALWEIAYKFKKALPLLKNYDVIQLINSHSIGVNPKTEIKLLKKLFSQNKLIFLMACGDDFPVVKHYLEGKERYHLLTPYLENNELYKATFTMKYVSEPYKKLFQFVYHEVEAIIPSDIDYKLPWSGWEKVVELTPNPILIPDDYTPININNRKVIIFLGINTLNYTKKGYKFFEEALSKLHKNYPKRVVVKTTTNLPFQEYVSLLNECDILLDNIYGYDQGYNALEAMARGKVVFTGAEKEFEEHYQLTKKVAINALPDVNNIYKELEFLILHPEKIIEIGNNARAFLEKEHNYIKVAKKYEKLYKSY